MTRRFLSLVRAMKWGQQTHRADPFSPVVSASLAMVLYLARRYDEAVAVLERAHEITPDHFLPHLRMGLVRVQQLKYDEAILELKTAVNLADQSTPQRERSNWHKESSTRWKEWRGSATFCRTT
jgi:tetratricopeptide (TPR) repeat protein